jgi:hypothetical protein
LCAFEHEKLEVPSLLRESLKPGSAGTFCYGRALPQPIPDLAVDETGVRATLTFGGIPAATFVPWEAVVLIAAADATKGFQLQCALAPEQQSRIVRPDSPIPPTCGPRGRLGLVK